MVGALIKINIRMLFAGLFRRYRKGKKPRPGIIVLLALLVIYVFGALFLTVGMMFYKLCGTFFELGIGWFYFTLAGLMIFALCFIGSFFMVQTQLFGARDNDLLLSMPVKPSAILAGRLAALLIFEYIYEIIVFIPVFAVLIITGYISYIPAVGIVFYFFTGLLLPLPALAVGCLFGWIVALITARMRRKNILTFVMTLVFLFVYLRLYSSAAEYINILAARGVEIADAVRRTLFPAYHLGTAVSDGSLLSFVIFAICAVVPFVIMCALLSHSFIKVATANRGAKKVVYRERKTNASGVGLALLKKELLRFFSNPMYILNASLGSIFTLVAAGALIVKPGLITDTLAQFEAMTPGVTPGIIGIAALTILAGFNFISAPAISLEGGKLWIIKSLPVPVRTVLLSKLGPHLIAGGVPAFLAGLVSIVRLPANGTLEALLMIIAPLSLTLLTALFGLSLNLVFNRFDWVNEMQPIKQGVSVMISMFGTIAVLIALGLIYLFLLHSVITPVIFILICVVLFIGLSSALYLYLTGAGVRRFMGLDS